MADVVTGRSRHKAQDVPGLAEVNMMNNPMKLYELVTATELARDSYRLRGTGLSRMHYEFWYVLLGMEAFDWQKLEVKCPVALAEMYRLAIDAP
ncbi:MAG: hypothetical protein E6750_18845 [Atlantibacter hermannii]|uniref:hypothetical protein n=1 Tax=Atlantibacter hermannii TaxID=565 RepID=UPI0028FEBF6D|nr:hypothetical protein [Atlantibacter hermannii]MDU1953442.1 hypothetical protein [Atlantibacter hermannii]